MIVAIITVVVIIIITIKYYFPALFGYEVDYVLANDGEKYIVMNLPDKKLAANKLADLKRKINIIIDEVSKDRKTASEAFRKYKNVMSENAPGGQYTSYTVNKGDNVYMCLRNPDDNKFINDNILMFVALHELAHVATKSVGHTQEFWNNFRFLLKHAIDKGYYTYQPYHIKPVEYCGSKISSTPTP